MYDIFNTHVLKVLDEQDVALYIGSIPQPSHILARQVPVALFLHGYIYHELFQRMLHGVTIKDKISAIIPMMMFKLAVSLDTVDLYICHSLAVCEANKLSKHFVLLPQWIFPDELKRLKKFETRSSAIKKDTIRMVAYTSLVVPPRLLNVNHYITLAQAVKRMVKRKFELIVVDPQGRTLSSGPIKIIRSMPRQEFLSLLASADLYIERSIDEELGYLALEAMSMGVPVAKLSHRKYLDRQDYKEDLILARSFRELAEKIAEYTNNVEHYYYYYSKRGREFVLTKRTWDAVKRPFLTALKHISR